MGAATYQASQHNIALTRRWRGTPQKSAAPLSLRRHRQRVDYWQWFDNGGDLPLRLEEGVNP